MNYINKGYATRVVINKKESTLQMYVRPNHIRDIFKRGVDQVGESPYITVEIGSIDNLEVFLNTALKQKKISGYSYENKRRTWFHRYSYRFISLDLHHRFLALHNAQNEWWRRWW